MKNLSIDSLTWFFLPKHDKICTKKKNVKKDVTKNTMITGNHNFMSFAFFMKLTSE